MGNCILYLYSDVATCENDDSDFEQVYDLGDEDEVCPLWSSASGFLHLHTVLKEIILAIRPLLTLLHSVFLLTSTGMDIKSTIAKSIVQRCV